jgi:hypothetical protein
MIAEVRVDGCPADRRICSEKTSAKMAKLFGLSFMRIKKI